LDSKIERVEGSLWILRGAIADRPFFDREWNSG